MRIVSISDLHGNLINIPKCDCLLISGDLVPTNCINGRDADRWLNSKFYDWLSYIKEDGIDIFGVAGNHDFTFQDRPEMIRPDMPWTYLEDSGVVYKGYNIWGTPWQPTFGGWAFNLDEWQLAEKWKLIPEDTHILLSHGPPWGIADRCGNKHVGSNSLRQTVEALTKLTVISCGHIHHERGVYKLNNGASVLSSSLVNGQYILTNKPLVIDIQEK